MRIEKFEDIQAWQKAKDLCLLVYKHLEHLKDYRFRDQIQSASVSIMNNIAEGFERKGNKELSRFLYIAKGSCGEVRSMLYLSIPLGYITEKDALKMNALATEISKMLAGFIRKINNN